MTTFDTRNGHVTIDTATHKAVPVNSIVLNPDSGVVWEFLQEHPRADQDHMTTNCLKGFLLAKEIRKQLPAPRIPEPGWGVVVEAGVKQHDERYRWTRISGDVAYHWNCENGLEYDREWSDLIDPEVVES